MSKRKLSNESIKKLAGIGVFSALAIVISFATSFIKVGYLSLDAGDIVTVLASFIYGPAAAVLISLVTSLGGFLYSGTLIWGFLMDFASSGVFSFVASFIYSRKRSFNSAIVGIYAAVICVVAVMIPLNILITPLYTPVSTEFVLKEIPRLILPFNLAKAVFNGGAALLVYKPLVRALRRGGLVPASSRPLAARQSARTNNTVFACGADSATESSRAEQSSAASFSRGGLSKQTSLALTLGIISIAVAAAVLIFLANL